MITEVKMNKDKKSIRLVMPAEVYQHAAAIAGARYQSVTQAIIQAIEAAWQEVLYNDKGIINQEDEQ
jgi:hypothetical protein